jgi:hypothetical protein
MDDVLHSVDAVPEVKRDKVSRNPTSVPRLIPSSNVDSGCIHPKLMGVPKDGDFPGKYGTWHPDIKKLGCLDPDASHATCPGCQR